MGRRAAVSRSSATSARTSPRRCAKAGARSSPAFPSSAIRGARSASPIRSAEATFLAAKLDWDDRRQRAARRLARWYRRLLAVRTAEIVPRLAGDRAAAGATSLGDGGPCACAGRSATAAAVLVANPRTARARGVPAPNGACSGRRARSDDGTRAVVRALVDRRPRQHERESRAETAACRARPTGCSSATDFGFRRCGGARALSGAARHQPCLSPRPTSRRGPGSTHGYDIVDHDALNPELGARADFAAMVAAFRRTASGRSSISCRTTWASAAPTIRSGSTCSNGARTPPMPAGSTSTGSRTGATCSGKLLVPLLGDQYGAVLERGKLKLKFDADGGSFAVWAYDMHKLPICAAALPAILGSEHPELDRLATPSPICRAGARRCVGGPASSRRNSPASSRDEPDVAAALAARWRGSNGRRWRPESLQRPRRADRRPALARGVFPRRRRRHQLPPLLQHQRARRPADGAAEVFEHTHQLIFATDRARAPRRPAHRPYRRPVRPQGLSASGCARRRRGRSISWSRRSSPAHESLREDWPVEGTTGYEFANLVDRLLVDPPARQPLDRDLCAPSPAPADRFEDIVRDCKLRSWTTRWRASSTCLPATPAASPGQNPTHSRLHAATSCDARSSRSSPASRSTAPMSTAPAAPTKPTGATSTGRWRRRGATSRTSIRSVFDFLHALLTGDLVAEPRSGFSRAAVAALRHEACSNTAAR